MNSSESFTTDNGAVHSSYPDRVFSIDAFRGITILVMIFVNELAGVEGIPAWMKHMPADADAMTFVDVVFPAFLFIVGMSIPFAILNRKTKGDTTLQIQWHIIVRTAGLLVLGLFMVNADSGYNEQAMGISIGLWMSIFYVCVILVWNVYSFKNKIIGYVLRSIGVVGLVTLAFIYRGGEDGETGLTPQWWGILGLIGWAYLVSSILFQILGGNKVLIALAASACVSMYVLDTLDTSNTIILWLAKQKGHAIHSSIVLIGLLLSLILFDQKNPALKRRVIESSLLAIILLIAAVALRPYFQISKIYATPSWALFSAVCCVVSFLIFYWIIEIQKRQRWAMFFKPAASNPLLTYIIPFIIFYGLKATGLRFPDFLYNGVVGMIWSVVYASCIMAFVTVLNRWKIRLQL